MVTARVDHCYSFDYNPPTLDLSNQSEGEDCGSARDLEAHARVYTSGHTYGIRGLKSLADRSFRNHVDSKVTPDISANVRLSTLGDELVLATAHI